MRDKREHKARVAAEVGKFGIVGIVNTALDIALFNLLLFTGFEHAAWGAKAVSTTVSAITSYFMNRHWTWRHRHRSGMERELPRFLVISALALGITEGCLLLSHYGFGLTSKLDDNIAANAVGLLLATAFRFWGFKRFVFLHPKQTPTASATHTATRRDNLPAYTQYGGSPFATTESSRR